MRPIDADALKAAITVDGYEHFSGCLSSSEVSLLEMVTDDIDEAPTIDAIPVVRCKDCKHRFKDSWCEYADDDDNFYCARGERKEGAERE